MIVTISFAGVSQKKSKNNTNNTPLSEDILLKAETSMIEAEKYLILEDYAKAFELFVLAKDLNPDNDAVYFKLAEVVVQNGDNEKGLQYITKAIELSPENKYYRIFKAEIEKAIGKYDEAISTYEDLINRVPGTESYLFELALLYQFQGNWNKALTTYERVEDAFGISIEILREKQQIYLRKNDMESLLKDWDRLIAISPYEPELILELCGILVVNEMYDEAQKRLEVFIKNNPDSDRPYMLLSEIERSKGNIDEAIDLLKRPVSSSNVDLMTKLQALNSYIYMMDSEERKAKIIGLIDGLVTAHPGEYQSLAFAGDLFIQLDDRKKALQYYRKAVNLSPASFNVWQNIVSIESELAEYDSLVEHSEKALEYFPNQAIFYFYGGIGYYFKKEYQRAARLLEQGKKYTSDAKLLAVFYGQLGDTYNSLSDHAKSDESYEKALESDPENDHALNNYSYYLSLRGEKMEKALEMSAKLVELHPNDPTYLDTHGWVLYVMGEYQKAEEFLRKAAQLDNDGTILEHYGDVLFKLGKETEALQYWIRAKESGGTSDLIDKKISERQLYE